MPRVIACLLRHLPLLQVDHHHWRHHYHHFCHLKRHHYVQYPYDHKVVDLANLHPGIEHYYRGTSNSKLSYKKNRDNHHMTSKFNMGI